MNVFRRGQDSLLGRHFTYYLAPFSVAELCRPGRREVPILSRVLDREWEPGLASAEAREALAQLATFGGFPEPLFRGEQSFLSRWRSTRLERLIHQDLAATENLKNLPLVENLMFLLPDRVGSPLSLNSLREDLEVHFATVKHWLDLLERVFYGFFLRPYSKKSTRMLRKEAKWYLWDWSEIREPGPRFENLVALHLLKYVHYLNQLGMAELSLHYVRDKEKREVDFLVCEKRKPLLLIECKTNREDISPSLGHFARLLGVKRAFQVVQEEGEPRTVQEEGVTVSRIDAASLLAELV